MDIDGRNPVPLHISMRTSYVTTAGASMISTKSIFIKPLHKIAELRKALEENWVSVTGTQAIDNDSFGIEWAASLGREKTILNDRNVYAELALAWVRQGRDTLVVNVVETSNNAGSPKEPQFPRSRGEVSTAESASANKASRPAHVDTNSDQSASTTRPQTQRPASEQGTSGATGHADCTEHEESSSCGYDSDLDRRLASMDAFRATLARGMTSIPTAATTPAAEPPAAEPPAAEPPAAEPPAAEPPAAEPPAAEPPAAEPRNSTWESAPADHHVPAPESSNAARDNARVATTDPDSDSDRDSDPTDHPVQHRGRGEVHYDRPRVVNVGRVGEYRFIRSCSANDMEAEHFGRLRFGSD